MPRITSLRLEKFKAFKEEQRIPIRPITLLYGQNSAGKSSVIDALLFMHHLATDGVPGGLGSNFRPSFYSSQFEFVVTGHPVRLGSIWEFVHGKGLEGLDFSLGCTLEGKHVRTEIKLAFDSDGLVAFAQLGPEGEWLFRLSFSDFADFHFGHDHRSGHVEVNTAHPIMTEAVTDGVIQTEAMLANWCEANPGTQLAGTLKDILDRHALSAIEFREAVSRSVADHYSRFRLSVGTLPPEPLPPLFHPNVDYHRNKEELSQAEGILPEPTVDARFAGSWDDYVNERVLGLATDIVIAQLEKFRQVTSGWAKQDFRSVAYCGAQRATLELDSMFPPAKRKEASDGVEVGGWVLSTSAMEYVNGWLQNGRPGAARYSIKKTEQKISEDFEAMKVDLVDVTRNLSVGLHEVGSGIGQIIPVLLAAAAYKDHIVCVKQPELHLHPAIQADVADAFIRFAGRTGDWDSNIDTAFLVESHSEHLLLRLMRRIRESTEGKLEEGQRPLRPDDVAILYVENLGSHSVVREMPLNDKGELVRDWPGGFFEEGLREVLQ